MKKINIKNIKNKREDTILMTILFIMFIFFYFITYSYSETDFDLQKEFIIQSKIDENLYKKNRYSSPDLLVPTVLIGYGVANHNFDSLKKIDNDFKNRFNFSNKRYKFDDFLQYLPIGTVLLFDCFSDNNINLDVYNNSNNFYITSNSLITMGILVTTFKHESKILRPDGSSKNSFPSGHTALAFTGAHLFHKKYGENYPFLSFLGYSSATITGFMRIVNNRHWLSDVITGAGFGILSTELTYLFLRKSDSLHPENQTIFLFPEINPDRISLTINYYF